MKIFELKPKVYLYFLAFFLFLAANFFSVLQERAKAAPVTFSGFTTNGSSCDRNSARGCGGLVGTSVSMIGYSSNTLFVQGYTGALNGSFPTQPYFGTGNTTAAGYSQGTVNGIPADATGGTATWTCSDTSGFNIQNFSSPLNSSGGGNASYASPALPTDGVCYMSIDFDSGSGGPLTCGDNVCSVGEDCSVCSSDCGACPSNITNVNISATPASYHITYGSNQEKVYQVTVSVTGAAQSFDVVANCESTPGATCAWFQAGTNNQLPRQVQGQPQSPAAFAKTAETVVGVTTTLDLHVRNYDSYGNMTDIGGPYNIVLSAAALPPAAGGTCVGGCGDAKIVQLYVDSGTCATSLTAPSNPSCSLVGRTGYTLNWTAPSWATGGTGSALNQLVRVAPQSPNGESIVNSGCGTGTCIFRNDNHPFGSNSIVVTGLQPGTAYNNRVAAQCTNPSSSISYKDLPNTQGGVYTPWVCTTLACQTTGSIRINGTTVVNGGTITLNSTSITIAWDAVTEASGYVITMLDQDAFYAAVVNTSHYNGTSMTVNIPSPGGLGHRYQLTVGTEYSNQPSSCSVIRTPVLKMQTGVCSPGATQGCTSNSCGGTQTCQSDGTWGSCTITGTHKTCQSNACVAVANVSSCTDSCTNNSDCTSCVANTGTSCNDGNACTTGETIQCNGSCGGGTAVANCGTLTCPTGQSVTLGSSSINVGATTSASAPAGYSGGSFVSSNTGAVTVSGSTVTGVGTGVSSISGSGWTYSNGSQTVGSCSLNGAQLTVASAGAYDFTVTSPENFSTNYGGTVPNPQNIRVTNTSSNGQPISMTISGGPAWLWVGFANINNLAAGSYFDVPVQPFSSSYGPGSFAGAVSFTSPQAGVRQSQVTYNVTGAVQGFNVTLSPPSRSINKGSNTTYTINVNSQSGYTNSVCVTYISGCPAGATCSIPSNGWNCWDQNGRLGSSVYLPPDGTNSELSLNVSNTGSVAVNTYNLTVRGEDPGLVTHDGVASLQINTPPPSPNPPTVALNCDGQNPATVSYNGGCTLNWVITNATSCSSNGSTAMPAGNWTTGGSNNSALSGITAARTYGLSCTGPGGSASGSLTINVGPDSPGGPTGGSSACQSITLNWTSVSGATGYYIYRSTLSSFPGSSGRIATINNGATVIYTDTPSAGTYYYWVSAFNVNGESSPSAFGNNPLGSSSCDATLGANKDITAVNGTVPAGYTPRDDANNEVPPNVTYNIGDIVSFAVNIWNNGASGGGNATNIIIKDSLTNLKKPTAGWAMKIGVVSLTEVTGGSYCTNPSTLAANEFVVCGSEPFQYIYIKTNPIAQGSGLKLKFNAQITVSAGFSSASSRFQNSANITYTAGGNNGMVSANTPSIIFSVSQDTTKNEVAP